MPARPVPRAFPLRNRLAHRLGAVAVTAVLLGTGATACSNDSDSGSAPQSTTTVADGATTGLPAPGPEAAAAALDEKRTVIDVRTPEEFEAGHIDGAERIGLADADFDARIGALDPGSAYVVYCRSGNRSAQAATKMRAAGLDVIDGGAMTDMVDAGWPKA